ncbi:MAG TPA: nickel-responsive transcriptional regulator NikR [candidate division Zixibacteria bacterium]|nr:nickel-responsive transcriptional regulator NikR [candidate division Zixibacteria bacterium]
MPAKRFSVSIDQELIERFDALIAEGGYDNRSQAVAGLISKALERAELASPSAAVVGALSFVFDHGRHLNYKLVSEQHRYIEDIEGIAQTHLDDSRSLEVILIRTTVSRAKELAGRILSHRGVISGELSLFPYK